MTLSLRQPQRRRNALGKQDASRAGGNAPNMPHVRPHIMHVVEAFGGGVYQSVLQLCHAVKDEATLTVVHGQRLETPADFMAQFPAGTRFIPLPARRAVHPVHDARATLALRRIIREARPQAVHAHSSKAGALVRLALSVWLNPLRNPFRKPAVQVLYSPRGYGFLMHNVGNLSRWFYACAEFLLGWLPGLPGTTVACGRDEFRYARRVSRRRALIANAQELGDVPEAARRRPVFKPGAKGAAGQLVVVGNGRITPQKNFPHFVKVARHFSGKNVHFLWLGGGDGEYYESVTRTLPVNLEISGWRNRDETMRDMDTRGHVYLHLSRWEGLSRSVMEAMARGYPVILSDIPGNRELARNATGIDNGFLCAGPEEAIAALAVLLTHPEQLTVLGDAARRHVLADYNWTNALRQWRHIYGLAE